MQGTVDAACDALIAGEAKLNGLDSKIGDGDTGTTMAGAARSLKGALPSLPLARPDAFFSSISDCTYHIGYDTTFNKYHSFLNAAGSNNGVAFYGKIEHREIFK